MFIVEFLISYSWNIQLKSMNAIVRVDVKELTRITFVKYARLVYVVKIIQKNINHFS